MSNQTNSVQITFQPLGRKGEFPSGTTLLEAARQLGVGLSGICGGAGTCGSCRVIIPPKGRDALSEMTDAETRHLDSAELAQGMRLACQARAQADLQVAVPPESLTTQQRTQVEGRQTPVELAPNVVPHDLEIEPPTLEDPRSDAVRIQDHLEQEAYFDLEVLRTAAPHLRDWEWHTRVALRDEREVAALLAPESPLLGLAVDLGTTKLAGYLIDLETGHTLAMEGEMNPQLAYGEDVMARITYAQEEPEGAKRLQEAASSGIQDLLDRLLEKTDMDRGQVVEAVVVGNTCMHHLFVGLPVEPLGRSPYVPVQSKSWDVLAREVGLEMAPGATVHLLPNVAGFVGADHVSAILAARLDEAAEPTLLLDIGTNTEICLARDGKLLSCSTASGPAFEGAHIRFGMRAAPGAIERVRMIDGQVFLETIDKAPPVGICGSGILDAVGELRRTEILNDRGGMIDDHPRVRKGPDGLEFILAAEGDDGTERTITISRRDVSEIQLAKAAIATGWTVLLEEVGLEEQDIARVVIAGAFGTYIDARQAVAIGMLPDVPLERFEQVGNVAGTGARMALVSCAERERAARIARQVDYIELTIHTSFQDRFTRELTL